MAAVRWIIRWCFAPAYFLGFLTLAISLMGGGVHPLWLLALLVVAILTVFVAERLLPYEGSWNEGRQDFGRDTMHALVNEGAAAASVATVPLLASLFPGIGVWPTSWPLWLQLALAIVVADVGITLTHYASHRWQMLWRLHAVHHSVTRMYGFNGLMKHPLHQAIETLAGTAPLLVLGLPFEVAALLGFAAAIQVMLQHANVDFCLGPFIRIWAVAPAHRHHHLASATDGDVNFALFTPLWDHFLGTYRDSCPAPRDGQIGIAGRPDYPQDYARQLVEPFRSSH